MKLSISEMETQHFSHNNGGKLLAGFAPEYCFLINQKDTSFTYLYVSLDKEQTSTPKCRCLEYNFIYLKAGLPCIRGLSALQSSDWRWFQGVWRDDCGKGICFLLSEMDSDVCSEIVISDANGDWRWIMYRARDRC